MRWRNTNEDEKISLVFSTLNTLEPLQNTVHTYSQKKVIYEYLVCGVGWTFEGFEGYKIDPKQSRKPFRII